MPEDDINKAFAKVVANSWSDEGFHAKLVADPTGTLAAAGVTIPAGKRVVLVENTDDIVHVILPARPTELSDEELDTVAAGFTTFTTLCGTAEGGWSVGG
jgi:hypothetical protein